jgi:hypothetical protein
MRMKHDTPQGLPPMEIGGTDEESHATTSDDDDDKERELLVVQEQGHRRTRPAARRTHGAARTKHPTTRSSQHKSIRSKDGMNGGEEGGMLNLFLWLGVAVMAALIVYNIQHLGEMKDTAADELQGQLKPSSSSTTYNTTTTTSNNNNTSRMFANETTNSSTIFHFP